MPRVWQVCQILVHHRICYTYCGTSAPSGLPQFGLMASCVSYLRHFGCCPSGGQLLALGLIFTTVSSSLTPSGSVVPHSSAPWQTIFSMYLARLPGKPSSSILESNNGANNYIDSYPFCVQAAGETALTPQPMSQITPLDGYRAWLSPCVAPLVQRILF